MQLWLAARPADAKRRLAAKRGHQHKLARPLGSSTGACLPCLGMPALTPKRLFQRLVAPRPGGRSRVQKISWSDFLRNSSTTPVARTLCRCLS